MERISGRIPSDNPPYQASGWFTELTTDERAELWGNAIRTMARLHQTPLPTVEFLREWGLGGVREHMALIRRCYDRARRGRDYPLLERCWEWLERNVPDDAPEGFAWGDARCSNLIFSGTQCVGLLDWDMTSLAGAECDLGWWLLFDLTGNGGGTSLPGIYGPGETIRLWEEAIGRKARDIEFWLMFNLFWLGGIMVRLPDFLIENGAPPEAVAGRDEANTAMSILHTRFGTGVEQGLGRWDYFRPVLD
jgi:aminoglycoside phosphotransferase (APT) family kinase protein